MLKVVIFLSFNLVYSHTSLSQFQYNKGIISPQAFNSPIRIVVDPTSESNDMPWRFEILLYIPRLGSHFPHISSFFMDCKANHEAGAHVLLKDIKLTCNELSTLGD